MTEQELTQFVWDIVDETIEHVFMRFPTDTVIRANIYTKLSESFRELAEDIENVG